MRGQRGTSRETVTGITFEVVDSISTALDRAPDVM
jgi:hypothetical protein